MMTVFRTSFFAALLSVACAVLVSCGSSSSKNNSLSSSVLSSVQSSLATSSTESVVSSASSLGQQSSASSSSVSGLQSSLTPIEDFYGLYVAAGRPGGDGLLGNAEKEQTFLNFVRDNGFNYLIFYDLFNDELLLTRADQVASLISRAKESYGVKQVALALGSKTGADTAVAYNLGHDVNQRIDVLNLEYEFWNEPNRVQAFDYALDMLRYFREVGPPQGLATETYIGWINAQEGEALGREVDRVLVHYYRPNDVNLIDYGLERLEFLASGRNSDDPPLVISPIFSNEGSLNTNDIPFMGEWLEFNPHEQAYVSWQAGYSGLTQSWKSKLEVEGATWFIYDKFLDVSNLQQLD